MNRWVGVVVALACLVLGSSAAAAWNSPGTGNAYSRASSLPSGNAPTTSVSGRNVSVSWTAPSGGAPVGGYAVSRYSAGGVSPDPQLRLQRNGRWPLLRRAGGAERHLDLHRESPPGKLARGRERSL